VIHGLEICLDFIPNVFLSTEVNSDFGVGSNKNIANFNEKYRVAWSLTSNYQKWRNNVSSHIGEEELAFHPGQDSRTLMQSLTSTVTSKASSMTNYFLKKSNNSLIDEDELDTLTEMKADRSTRNLPTVNSGERSERSERSESSEKNTSSERKLIRGLSLNNVFGNSLIHTNSNHLKSPSPSPQTNQKKLKAAFTLRHIEKPEIVPEVASRSISTISSRSRVFTMGGPSSKSVSSHKSRAVTISTGEDSSECSEVSSTSKSVTLSREWTPIYTPKGSREKTLDLNRSPREIGDQRETIDVSASQQSPTGSPEQQRSLPTCSVSTFYPKDSSQSAPDLGTSFSPTFHNKRRRWIRGDIVDPLPEQEQKNTQCKV
jgi:hypothetical protein